MYPPIDDIQRAYYAQIAAGKTWAWVAKEAMNYLMKSGEPFSADDLRELLRDVEQPSTMNAYGGLFNAYATAGLIKRVGGGPSKTRKRNHGHRNIWIGVKYA